MHVTTEDQQLFNRNLRSTISALGDRGTDGEP